MQNEFPSGKEFQVVESSGWIASESGERYRQWMCSTEDGDVLLMACVRRDKRAYWLLEFEKGRGAVAAARALCLYLQEQGANLVFFATPRRFDRLNRRSI